MSKPRGWMVRFPQACRAAAGFCLLACLAPAAPAAPADGVTDAPTPAPPATTIPATNARPGNANGTGGKQRALSLRERVAREAGALVGAGTVIAGGKAMPNDCSGFVRGVLLRCGVDPYRTPLAASSGNGVALIYDFCRRSGGLSRGWIPATGDIIFFDDTYDLDGDRRWNDAHTHIGIVERVDADGTVTFVHRIWSGVRRDVLNLRHPDKVLLGPGGRQVNAWLRVARAGDPPQAVYLTAQLFRSFGWVEKE